MSTAARAGAIAAVVCLAAPLAEARADAAPAAYIDELANFSSLRDSEVRSELHDALDRAGYTAAFAAPGIEPCAPEDRRCVADRAGARGASIGVRATWVELAGEHSVAIDVIGAGGGVTRHVVSGLGDPPSRQLASAIASIGIERSPASARNTAAWSFTGASVALAAAGAAATWRAWHRRRAFFSEHVDDDGDIVGISPSGARAAETRARTWSLAGAVLFAGAAASGITAGVLFSRGGSDGGAGAVVVGGRF